MKIFRPSLLLVVAFTFITHSTVAQKEANIWYFGNLAGIDFNSGAAVSITNSAMATHEGCSSISDKNTGALLFYTNGAKVWNANHLVMDNGNGLTADVSSSQGAVIVPDPGNSNQYYIFTSGEFYTNGNDGYRYSIVDMSLNGGLGAVTAVKNVLLYTPASEKLAVVKNSSGTGYWIATHEFTGSNFVCYELTGTGISAPVISSTGTSYSNYNPVGCLKFSTDGTRLATVLSGLDEAELYDFDALTGIISNAVNLGAITNNIPYVYGIAFSPNGKRLYVDEESNTGLFQFDLDAGTLADIIASKTVVGTVSNSTIKAMQLGPDGKLYIAKYLSQYLAVVNDPDSLGINCNFTSNGLYLDGATSVYGLPGFTENVFGSTSVQQVNVSASDSAICEKFCIDFFDLSVNNPLSWQWEFNGGNPSSSSAQNPSGICYDLPGTYDVTLITSNANGNDTITLTNFITVYATPPFPVISQTDNVLSSSAGSAYQWQFNAVDITGATNQSYTITQSGFYTVHVTDMNGCNNAASGNFIITGVEEVFSDANLLIYPNPSSGSFTIELLDEKVAGYISMKIMNTLGQYIFTLNEDNWLEGRKKQIDLCDALPYYIADGVYFVEVSTKYAFIRKKSSSPISLRIDIFSPAVSLEEDTVALHSSYSFTNFFSTETPSPVQGHNRCASYIRPLSMTLK